MRPHGNGRQRVKRGRFIALEGLDGAGTTTQAQALAEALRVKGLTVLVTREPSTLPIGAMIRQALAGTLPLPPASMALLFAADRLDHVAREIEPALAQGHWVISDRYVISSLAYQGAQLPMAWVEVINRYALACDLTLFVDVDPEVGKARRAARGGPEELYDGDAMQRATRQRYHEAIALPVHVGRVKVIDGGAPIADVTKALLAALEPLL